MKRFRAKRRSAALLAASLLAVSAVAGASAPAAATDWTTFGFDPQRTGYNPGETVLGTVYALNAATGAIIWQTQLATVQSHCSDFNPSNGFVGVLGTPTIDTANNRVFVVSGDGNLHALDIWTGVEHTGWPVQLLDQANAAPRTFVYGSPTLTNSRLYMATASACDQTPYHGQIVEVYTPTRSVLRRWFVDGATGPDGGGIWGFGGVSVTPGLPADFHIYAATGNAFTTPENAGYAENIVRLDAYLNVIASNSPAPPNVDDADFGATPLLFQPPNCPPMLAAMQKTGKLFIYNRYTIDSGPMQTIQVAPGSSNGNFIGMPAYDPVLNQIYLGSPTDSGGGPYHHGLIAMSVQANCSLGLAWQTQVGLNASSYDNPVIPPTVANGVVYYADGDLNEVFAFNAQTGQVLWRFSPVTSHGIYASPTVVNGKVFVGAFDHKLYAFGL